MVSKHPRTPREDGERDPQALFHHGGQVRQILQKIDRWDLIRVIHRTSQLGFQSGRYTRRTEYVVTRPRERLSRRLPSCSNDHVHLIFQPDQRLLRGR